MNGDIERDVSQTEREQRRINVDIHKMWSLEIAIHDVGRVSVLGTARHRLCCMRVSILYEYALYLFRLITFSTNNHNHYESPSRLMLTISDIYVRALTDQEPSLFNLEVDFSYLKSDFETLQVRHYTDRKVSQTRENEQQCHYSLSTKHHDQITRMRLMQAVLKSAEASDPIANYSKISTGVPNTLQRDW